MKAALTLFFSLVLSSSILIGANFNIKGVVIDGATSGKLDYINVQLFNSDSVFVKGTTTDEKGVFTINAPEGDYWICASYLGYEDNCVSVSNLSKDIDLGEIPLHKSSINLGEVTVTADPVINKTDRQIILPSEMQVDASSNGLELLRNLQLSRINVNILDKTITLPSGDAVQLRINGVEVSEKEIQAINPADVIRIEYHDNPGLRYNNAGAVIDYILKRRESGGSIMGEGFSKVENLKFIDGFFAGKYNNKKSEFSTNVYLNKRDIMWNRENYETFRFPTETIERIEVGDETPAKYDYVGLSLNYNLQDANNYMFNARFRNNYRNNPSAMSDRESTLYQGNDTISIRDKSSYKSNTPSLDLYFQKDLKNDQLIIFNLVGTYVNTKNTRNYLEAPMHAQETRIMSDVKGERYSLIGEAIYEKQLKVGKISGGVKHTQSYLENTYTEDVNTVISMNTAETYAYAQYNLNKGKLGYVVGVGAMRTFNKQGNKKNEKYIFRPSATISYNMNDNIYMRYNAYISGNAPSLGDLNDISQAIDIYQIRRGNSNLKTVTFYSNDATVSYRKNKFNVELFGRYSYDHKPIMDEVFYEDGKFVRQANNQKGFHRVNLRASLQYQPFKDNLSIKVSPFLNRYISYGNDYTHTYTNTGVNVNLLGMYKNWTVGFDFYTKYDRLWGEKIDDGEQWNIISLGYKTEKWAVSGMLMNTFGPKYERETKDLSELAPYRQIAFTNNFNPMFGINLSFNLNFGRKYQGGNKRLNNEDSDSGVLSGKK